MDLNSSEYFYAFLALLFVLGLIGLLALIARRFGLGFPVSGRANNSRRLAVSEMLPLDSKRRLVLFRRDGTEHLVLLGAESDLLIEANIQPPQDTFATVLSETSSRVPAIGKDIN
jgi:flagellar protein FliO/FliZ